MLAILYKFLLPSVTLCGLYYLLQQLEAALIPKTEV
jgi:hypothetical protein